MDKINLMIPIFYLYDIQSMEEVVFDKDSSEYLKNMYSLEHRKNIYNALKWAEERPGYEFKNIIKDAPVSHKLKFTNRQVYTYLMKFKEFMKNKEYELLTDNRPSKEF